MAALKIAILFENVQSSDVACADILWACESGEIRSRADFGFGYLQPHAVDMEFCYVSSSTEAAVMTPGFRCIPTHTYDTAPRDVDVLLVGGPSLRSRPTGSLEYMREVCADKKPKVIMTTCVGSLWLADSGVLKGIKGTVNRGALVLAKQLHPDVEWQDRRWVVDRKDHLEFWTAGGAGAGADMLCIYVKQNFHESIAMAAWDTMDLDPTVRGQDYTTPMVNWFDLAEKQP